MELQNCFASEEDRQLLRCATESADPASVSPLEIRTPKSPKSPHAKQSPRQGSPVKHDPHSQSGSDDHPKKGGSGGKGTWGGLLEGEGGQFPDHNDPNYTITKESCLLNASKPSVDFQEFKKNASIVVEEYFTTGDISSTGDELKDLQRPSYHYYFVKKLLSMAMDRHDKEKEMAAVLLSALYADVITAPQVYKGFTKLAESADDFCVDIPDAVDILSLFIARAVVDDILPPVFLTNQMASLPKDSKGSQVIKRADKNYLSAPHHAEIILQRWGGSNNVTVEDVKVKIDNLLMEYVASGDKSEARRCIKALQVPFFHHDIVKRALIVAMERRETEGLILDLLKVAAEEGLINASQISKGFNRLIDTIDDLSLDILFAKDLLQSLISKAASEGWLCASSLMSLCTKKQLEDNTAKNFKPWAITIIKEYFLTGDILEVISSLESENVYCSALLNAIFIKKLIILAMDRKNREREMASVLLTSLCFPAEDVVTGFMQLIETAEDTALDNPATVEDLAMFLARAVVDEVLAPSHLEDLESQCEGPDSIGSKAIRLAHSLLHARLGGERILRCWGGGGGSKAGWGIEDVKDKIKNLLEEYDIGGDVKEACRCIMDLGMPFFHHEVVKKALVTVMEKKQEKLWNLLKECYSMGLITTNQMMKGFGRVDDCIDDLVLDIPDVKKQFAFYTERAKQEGWLDSSFSTGNSAHPVENGFCS